MNDEFDLMDYNPELSNLTPQEILNLLSESDNKLSGNPEKIMKAINNFNAPKFSELSELNNEIVDTVGSYDYLSKADRIESNKQEKDQTNLNLFEILDEMIGDGDDIDAIEFNTDCENIYESEDLTIEKLEKFHENIIDEKDIPVRIRDKNKKIGSAKQKTINLFELYGQSKLLFAGEADELFEVLRNKLLIYWDIVIDFEDTEVSDAFLLKGIGDICQWLNPTELLERVEFANIDDDMYVRLHKTIIPNAYKKWLNEDGKVEENIALSKMELYQELEPSEKVVLEDFQYEKLADKTIPFEFISASFLGKKREKKLKYPVYYVEKVIGEVLTKYDIDETINSYISTLIDDKIDWKQVQINCKQRDLNENYVLQFGIDEFKLIYEFVQSILLDKCREYLLDTKSEIDNIKKEMEQLKEYLPREFISKVGCFQNLYFDTTKLKKIPDHIRFRLRRMEELEFALLDLEHKYFVKEDILKNVFEIIGFSMYKTGLDKVKLIAYHYLAKYMEDFSEDFWNNKIETKKIRGHVTSIEMFRFEMVKILQQDDNLKKFVFTIRELIAKWVFKYTYNSSLARVYFDFMMITPEMLTEMITRYIALIAVKNKNPMTLRAIYSSYISLIHTSIYLTINSNVYNKKYGFFKALEHNQDEGFSEAKRAATFHSNKKAEVDAVMKCYMLKHPKELNENYYLMKRLDISAMLELNSLKLYAEKPDNIPLHDWWYYYVRYFQHMDKDIVYKIKSKFIKSDKRNTQMNYIGLITHEILREPLYKRIKDYTCVDQILEVITEDISMRTINRGYMDKNFKLIVKSNTEYLDQIHKLLIDIRDNLNKE